VRARASSSFQARTKVFVIDEVHMLSRNVFNALLTRRWKSRHRT
jgi:DNA polymerase III gamma/tau subunit